MLCKRRSTCPYMLEAIEVEGRSTPAAAGVAHVKYRRLCRWDAICVLIYQELAIGTVDRVIENGAVEPDLDVLDQVSEP